MEPTTTSVQTSLAIASETFLASLVAFLPRLLAAVLIFVIGIAIAGAIKNLIIRSFGRLNLSKRLKATPLQNFLEQAELSHTVEHALGSVAYWIIVLFIVYTSVTVLGLETASVILNRVLLYIPNVFSAVLILVFGTLLAGLAEAVVKGAIRSVDGRSARLIGKITSYLIITIAIMAGISELGIAQQFITTLFTGVVAAVALAIGLAFGLGSKETVNKMMSEWYERMRRDN